MNDKKNELLIPGEGKITIGDSEKTERTVDREREDSEYTPVIIKRNDEAIRHPDDILEKAIEEGLEQYKRPNLSLFISSIAAGLILGFAGMCVALASQLFDDPSNPLVQRFAMAIVYPLGFIVCVMSGTQLFTEQTATSVYPVLEKKIKLQSLLRVWFIVLLGNLVGTLISSKLLVMSENTIMAKEGFLFVANHLMHSSFGDVFVSAILAGWLMAQGGWLILSTPPASSQIQCIFIVTFIIGIGGLHHSIAGSAEIFTGLMHSTDPNYKGALSFLISAILGNLVGGSFFVGALNYAHIRKTQ